MRIEAIDVSVEELEQLVAKTGRTLATRRATKVEGGGRDAQDPGRIANRAEHYDQVTACAQNGARVGDLFMSLIYTAELCGANPFDYLTELQLHEAELCSSTRSMVALELSRHAARVGPRRMKGLIAAGLRTLAESSPSYHCAK